MKKLFKSTKFTKLVAAAVLSAVTVASMSVSAFAAEPVAEVDPANTIESTVVSAQDPEIVVDGIGGVMPLSNQAFWLGSNNSFKNISVSFPSSGGLFSVLVDNFNPSDYQMDIMMFGSNGLLWQEDDCLGSSNNRAFSCGSNVKSISLRIIPRNRLLFPATPRAFYTHVSW